MTIFGDTKTASVEPEMGQAREAFTSFEENDIQPIFLKISVLTRMIYSKVINQRCLINPILYQGNFLSKNYRK